MSDRLSIGVLNDYQNAALKHADWSRVRARCDITIVDRAIDPATDIDLLSSFDILCVMRERTAFPRSLIEELPRLKLLITTGAGNAAIDLNAAREHGVRVCGTGNGDGRRATAELTWGLIIAAARDVVGETRALRDGGWQVGIGSALWGRTLGLLGLGLIGSMLASYGRAFGMDVIAWSDNLTPDRASSVGARLVSRNKLFAQSDVLSVHQVLSERTRNSIGAAEFAIMRPTAIFVNTSRGPIIDEAALLDAIDQGKIAAAALDTFVEEPLPIDHPFRRHPRIIATPHIGYVERDVYRIFFSDTVAAIETYLGGGEPARFLNPVGKDLGPNVAVGS